MRVIAGKAKGMRLRQVGSKITRPITDRVKESLFNIIGEDIQGASMLDLFAGTGSVGIEALSRGASRITFVEKNKEALKTIKDNLCVTNFEDSAEIIDNDAFKYLSISHDLLFDYVFVAPPQYNNLWYKSMKIIDNSLAIVDKDSWIIVQIDPVEYKMDSFDNLYVVDKRKYGNTLLLFYMLKHR